MIGVPAIAPGDPTIAVAIIQIVTMVVKVVKTDDYVMIVV